MICPGRCPMRHQLRAADSYSNHRSWRVQMLRVGVPVVPVDVATRTHWRASVKR